MLGYTVRILDVPFHTVRMCVAGSVNANVLTCFSVGGTVRLIFPAGGIGDPRFVLNFCLLPGGSGLSFCPAALSLLRGFGAAWSFVLEARALVVVVRFSASPCTLTVSSPLRLCFRPGPGFCRRPGRGTNTNISGCRRPGRGKNTGLAQLASHEDLSSLTLCSFVLTASATRCVCWRFP